jgi:hypothetical protein
MALVVEHLDDVVQSSGWLWWLNILTMLSKVRDGFGGYHASPPFCMEGFPLRLLSVGPWFQ